MLLAVFNFDHRPLEVHLVEISKRNSFLTKLEVFLDLEGSE